MLCLLFTIACSARLNPLCKRFLSIINGDGYTDGPTVHDIRHFIYVEWPNVIVMEPQRYRKKRHSRHSDNLTVPYDAIIVRTFQHNDKNKLAS